MTIRRNTSPVKAATRRAITVDELNLLKEASDALAVSIRMLRAMACCFEARAEVADVATGVRIGIQRVKAAADALFDCAPGDWLFVHGTPLLRRLWDIADVLSVTGAVLDAGKYPDGNGMTECPIQGALLVVCQQLQSLETAIRKLAERASVMVTRARPHPKYRQKSAAQELRA